VQTPKTSLGFVDSASTYEIVAACDIGNPKEIYPWAWIVASDVTMGLIFLDHIRLAPSPGHAGKASDLYAELTDALLETNVLGMESPPDQRSRRRALDVVRKQLARPTQLADLRHRIEDLNADEVNYRPWLDWIVRSKSWLENSRRLGTLVNPEFSHEIASVLNISRAEVMRLADLSGRRNELERLMRKPGGETFGLLANAFLASALIRGKYHELVIGNRAQLIRHPMRARPTNRGDDFLANKIQAYFASALLAGALTGRSPRSRIKAWVRGVIEARKAVATGQLYLKGETSGHAPISDDDALQRAVDDAIKLKVAESLDRFYRVLDVALQIGVTGAGFILNPPAAAAVSLSWWAASPVSRLGKVRRRHLVTEMARFGPGIVDHASTSRFSINRPR
jgi:hypothetical protein